MSVKTSFVLYHDIRGPLELLSDAERGKLFLAILDYSERGEQPAFEGALKMAFAFIKLSLDRDAASWAAKSEKRAESGRKGGKQRAANQANATFAKQNQANQAVPVPVPVPVPVSAPVSCIPSPNGEGSEDFSGKSSTAGKGDMQKAVDAWNSLNLKSVTKLTPDTERYIMLKKRIADYGIDEVLRAIENVRTSPFLNGHNDNGFQCTFDWFLKPNNFPKVLDGNYNDGEALKLDPRAYDGARWLASQIAERVSGFQTPTPQELDRWARDLDTLHRHGYTWKQISDTAVWAMDDDFWSSVITSGEALRKNFVKLMAKEAATQETAP